MSKKVIYHWMYKDTEVEIIVHNKYAGKSRVSYSFEHNGDVYRNDNCSCVLGAWDDAREQIDEIYCKACDDIDDLEYSDKKITQEMAQIFID